MTKPAKAQAARANAALVDAPLLRVAVAPSPGNGLQTPASRKSLSHPVALEQEVLLGLQEAKRGDFASTEEVASIFARHCPEAQSSMAPRMTDSRRQGKGGATQALLRDRAADRARQ